ncbi:CocE/NonD family hydrolase, partial [Dolichospermum sp. ST_sed7]|nr:CocE/NonD family hydrolase [Dolichospermum sp. ST_sed7]
MRTKVKKSTLILLILSGAVFLPRTGLLSGEQISKPFEYSGYSSPQWESYTRVSAYVPMPDGVKIAVDVFLPTVYKGTGKTPSKFPVVLQYTPYHRSMFDPKSGGFLLSPAQRLYLSYGYAYAGADMRGTGGSFGWNIMMDPILREDGKRVIDWIAAQTWSDGNVGMEGGSYVGWSQLACASHKPKALKCIVPNEAGFDGLLVSPGGIRSSAFIQYWSGMMYYINRNTVPTFWRPIPPVPPVVDEDGDGMLADEIPVDKNGQWSFSDDYRWPVDPGNPPQYADGVARKDHYYFNAVMEHIAHPAGAPGSYDLDLVAKKINFWDDKRDGDGLTSPDINFAFLPDVMESKIPVYNVGGWFDPFV